MAALPLPPSLEALRRAVPDAAGGRVVRLGVPDVDAILPDGGFPRGAVTELASSSGLGLATTLALSACTAAQAEARVRGGESAWCGFVDPTSSVHGPGAKVLGVDLARLLVVRPPMDHASVARVAARMIASHVFSVVVVDASGVPGAPMPASLATWATATRRIALAAEGSDTAIVLLTTREASRSLPLPVAMRVEVAQPDRGRFLVRVAKERRGRVTSWRGCSLAREEARRSA